MEDMSEPTGRRAANKLATQGALREAAERLFAENGYEATTVAQIARAAGVGERTFYRYFDGKEDLLAERALAWIDRLNEAIRARPAAESPYQAVANAMTAMGDELARSQPEYKGWMVGAVRPLAPLRRVEPRPLRRLEQSIAGAVLARHAATAAPQDAEGASAAEFEAQLLASIAVAALRIAVARQRKNADGPGIDALLKEAFTRLRGLTAP